VTLILFNLGIPSFNTVAHNTIGLLVVRHGVVTITSLSSIWSQYVVAVAPWQPTNSFTLVFE